VTAILAALLMLLCGAASSVLLARRPRLGLLIALSSIAGASLLCITAALPCLTRGREALPTTFAWPLPLGAATLAIDGLSAWFLLTFALLSISVAIYAWSYLQAEIGRGSVPALGAFLCVLVAALILVVTAADVPLFLVAWELLMLASFFLVSFHHRRADVRRAAWTYLIVNHVGTALFLLPLFGVLAAMAGATAFSEFRAALQGATPGTTTALFLLGLLGFGTKAGFMPMHIWLPVAHPAAPTPASALLSGVVVKAGIYGLLRLLGWLPSLPTTCAVVMLLFGMTSGVLGVLYALAQHDIKRLLAYHSVENIGIIGLGIGMGMLGQTLGQPPLVALGYGGALLHVLNHALFKGLLFLSAGAVIHATGTGDLERLGGLARKTPINAGLFLIAAVSICGLPPFNGFVSEWLLYGSLFSGAMSASRLSAGASAMGALALALMGGLALACFAKVFGVVFLGEPRDASIRPHPTPSAMKWGMAIPALLCIVIGMCPGLIVPLTAGGVRAVAGITREEFTAAAQTALSPAGQLTMLATVLLVVGLALGFLRYLLLRRNMPHAAPAPVTWGCGYARPSARMQYTASSFAWSLIESFRHVLWPHRRVLAPTGPFPGHAELESQTLDMAEHDCFIPLLRGVSRAFRMIRTVSWTGEPASAGEPPATGGRVGAPRVLLMGVLAALRRGRIHVCVAFIVLTLLVVFLIEAL
jgi:hydrogenase-4 component B